MKKVIVKEMDKLLIRVWVDKDGMKCVEMRFRDISDLNQTDTEEITRLVNKAWSVKNYGS